MNEVNFLKPTSFNIPDGELLARMSMAHYKVKQFGTELSLPIVVGSLSKNFAEAERPELNVTHLISQDVCKLYYDMKMMTFHCSWLGETLFERLKIINHENKEKPEYTTVVEKFIEKKTRESGFKITYERLDFMSHKGLLSCILKEYEKSKEKLPFDRKAFSGLFNDIIIQRNNYTHGELFLLDKENGFQTIIECDKGYQIIDQLTLNSFNQCYEELIDKLLLIRSILPPRFSVPMVEE